MAAYVTASTRVIDDNDINIQVHDDFNNLFKDENRLKVTIWFGGSTYISMGAESWFALTAKVAGEWGDAMRKAGHPMMDDPCIPASID